jgi:tripartite-type tricarboxylate transporter receptor subunit TctC
MPVKAAVRVGMLALSLLSSAVAARAQDAVAQFYKGKTINFYIGYTAGGTYDLYARLVARFMGEHIPGKPVILPRNMPGSGGHIAAGYVDSVVQPDGTSFATADSALVLEQITGNKSLRFDTGKLQYIGNPIVTNNVMVTWYKSGIHSIDDAKRRDVTMGATGTDNPGAQYPRAANELLGTRFKLIYGYPGSSDLNIAMENGEIEGRGSNDWVGWKATKPDWVTQHKIIVLAQIGLTKEKDLPEVPLLMDLAANDSDHAVLRVLSAPVTLSKQIFTSPGVPQERVDALRKAFDETVKDPEFLAEAARERLDINPVSGAEMQKLVGDMIADTPKAVADRLREIMGEADGNTGSH